MKKKQKKQNVLDSKDNSSNNNNINNNAIDVSSDGVSQISQSIQSETQINEVKEESVSQPTFETVEQGNEDGGNDGSEENYGKNANGREPEENIPDASKQPELINYNEENINNGLSEPKPEENNGVGKNGSGCTCGKPFGTKGRHRKECALHNANSSNAAKSKGIEVNNASAKSFDISTSSQIDWTKFSSAGTAKNDGQNVNTEQVNAAKYISGALLLIIIDIAFSNLIAWLMRFFSPKYKTVKASEIKLSKEQRKELEPLSDAVVKELTVTLTPTQAFIFTLGGFYVSNAIAVASEK